MSTALSVSQRAARATRHAALLGALLPGALLCAPLLLGYVWGEIDNQREELAYLCAFREQARLDHGLWLFSLIGNGTPTLGWPSSALYPFRWLQLLFPPDLGASLHPVVHLTAGAAATAWLARTFRLHVAGAATAGTLFVLCGTSLDLIGKPYYAAGALYLPLVWAAARRALSVRGRPVHVWVVAAGLALDLLGGEAQTFGMISAVVLLEVGFALRRGAGLARAGSVLAAVVASACVGWLQWGQSLAEAQLTARATSLSGSSYDWSFSPVGWLSALWPASATGSTRSGDMLAAMFTNHPDAALDWNVRAYVGLVFLCALVVGATGRRVLSATLVVVAFLLASLGDLTPFLPTVNSVVPLLQRFRYPAKYLVPVMCGAAVVVAFQLERAKRSRAGRRPLVIALVTGLVGNAALWLGVVLHREGLARLAEWDPAERVEELPILSQLLERGAMHTALFGTLALVALFAPRPRRGLVYLVVIADLAAAAPLLVSAHPPLYDVHGPQVLLRAPDDAGPADVAVVCLPDRFNALSVIQVESDTREFADMRSARFLGVPEMQACDGVAGAVNYSAPMLLRTAHQYSFGLDESNTNAARALGCTHMLDDRPPRGGGAELLKSFAPGGRYFDPQPGVPRLFRLQDPIPPAFVALDPEWVEEEDLVLRVARAGGVEPLLGLVDAPLSEERGALPDGRNAVVGRFEWDVRDEAVVAMEGEGGAVVGLRTTFRVGWTAEQAGEPLRTVRVAGVQLAAIVPDVTQGPILFRYRPPGWPAALVIAAIGLALGLGAGVLRRRADRPKDASEA